MRKKTPHLDLYKRWLEKGRMENVGLCNASYYRKIKKQDLYKFRPSYEDIVELQYEGKSITFWGSDSPYSQTYIFTTLRQTILLFIAAMNNEL